MRLAQLFEKSSKQTLKLQSLAKKLNVDIKEFSNMSDKEVLLLLKTIGKHDFIPDSEFNAKQLSMGINIESEHTRSALVAKLIAKDHLSEDPLYYTKLKKMETA